MFIKRIRLETFFGLIISVIYLLAGSQLNMCCYAKYKIEQEIFKGVYGSKIPDASDTCGVAIGDYDNDGVFQVTERLFTNGSRKLFYLKHKPIHQFCGVEVDGTSLPPGYQTTASISTLNEAVNYCFHPKNAWISFREAYLSTTTVTVTYRYSRDMDIIGPNAKCAPEGCPSPPCYTYKNDSDFNFIQDPLGMSADIDATFCDLDQDGDLDTVFTGGYYGINDGTGSYSGYARINFYMGTTAAEDVLLGDYDNDGDQDVGFVIPNHERSAMFENHGYSASKLMITRSWENTHTDLSNTKCGDFGDFDNDGDLDLMFPLSMLSFWENKVSTGPFLYVTNPARRLVGQVVKLDANTLRMASSANYRDPNLSPMSLRPQGVAIDDNYIYVTLTEENGTATFLVKREKQDFHLVCSTGIPPLSGWRNQIHGIAVDDDYIYTCNYTSDTTSGMTSTYHLVEKRDKSDLSLVNTIGTRGSGQDQFKEPIGIAVYDQSLYITDSKNNRIVIRDKNDLSYQGVIDGGVAGNPTFNRPYGIDVDTTHIYVSDMKNARIVKIDKTDHTNYITVNSYGPTNITAPKGICVDDNYVYVADEYVYAPWSEVGRIIKYNKSDLSYHSRVDYAGSPVLYGPYPFGPQLIAIDTNPTSIEHMFCVPTTAPTFTPVCPTDISDVEFADFDNDGKLDIVFATNPGNECVYRNECDFSCTPAVFKFTKIWESASSTEKTRVATGDVDNDGDLDLAFSGTYDGASGAPTIMVFTNNGSGNFTYEWGSHKDSDQDYRDFEGHDIELGDMDGDGWLDIICSARPDAMFSDPFLGIVVFGNTSPVRVTKITATTGEGIYRTKVIMHFKVKEDGTLGELISTEFK